VSLRGPSIEDERPRGESRGESSDMPSDMPSDPPGGRTQARRQLGQRLRPPPGSAMRVGSSGAERQPARDAEHRLGFGLRPPRVGGPGPAGQLPDGGVYGPVGRVGFRYRRGRSRWRRLGPAPAVGRAASVREHVERIEQGERAEQGERGE